MLRRLGPAMRLSLAVSILSWLLLQTVLTLLGHDPGMVNVGRTVTLLILLAAPLCIGLLLTFCPDADFPPKKLELLLMVAAFGFATAMMLRWVFKSPRSAGAERELVSGAV